MALNKIIDLYREKLIKSTQEWYQSQYKGEGKESMPFGEEINKALEYALKLGEELGFLVGNVDGYAGFIEFGHGDETLAILAHLDVVPAGKAGPILPLADRSMIISYMEGAIDDKGPAMAALLL